MKKVTLHVNGKAHHLDVPDSELLVETLRQRLNLSGTKYSCLEGDCGVCTVLLDGKNVLSCLVLTVDAAGAAITTIEGLSGPGELHPLQESFIDAGAIQCGFCTPGMILTAKAFLDENPHPSESEVKKAISGNLCRCTGYTKIVEAILSVAEKKV